MSEQTPGPSDTPRDQVDPTAPFEEHPELAPPHAEQPPAPPAPEAPQPPPPPPYAQQPPAPPAPEAPQPPPPPPYAQQPPPAPGAPYVPPAPYSSAVAAPAVQPLQPSEERTWGMLSHLIAGAAMLFSGGFLGFVGSLVIYLVFKDRGPFVRAHATNSLNVQITAGIGFIVGWVLTFTIIGAIIGIPILIVVFVWAVIVHIIGAIKANNGEWWTPPFTPQFVK